MLSEKMGQALNNQLNAETYSAYLYMAMSSYFAAKNLPGFANWMYVQTKEELAHAMKFYNYIQDRGGTVVLGAIEAPPAAWDTPIAVFEATLAHERKVTGLINDLVALARDENDNATMAFLQWFVSEQVEEESTADGVLQRIKLTEGAPGGLFIMDQEMAARRFTPPAGMVL